MTLTIDRRLMDAIYASRLKLFVSAADAAALGKHLDRDALGAMGIELIQYHPAPGTNGEGRLHSPGMMDGEFVALSSPPTGHCILAAATPHGRAELAPLLTWWRDHGANGAPELLELDVSADADPAAWDALLYRRLFELMREEAQRSAEREVQLCGQLYELRQEYEQARGTMQAMQEQLERLNRAPCQLVYAFPPSAERYRPGRDGDTIRQLLPVPARGLAGFDLYSPPEPDLTGGDEYVVITLLAREADAVLGAWTVRGNQLGRGWIHCAFPVALSDPYQHLELTLKWFGATDHGAGFALSPIDPWHELSAVVDEQPIGGALAQVVWAALPGAKVGSSSVPFHPLNGPLGGDVFEYHIGRDEIARMTPTSPTSVAYLVALPDRPGFRLHPLDGILATAVLPNACLPGTRAVSAIVQITNASAKFPIEYAIALTEAAAECRTFPTHPADAGVVDMSDWQVVPPDGSPHTVGLSLSKPAQTALDLHVGTRMSNGQPTANAWADWLELRLTLRYATPMLLTER